LRTPEHEPRVPAIGLILHGLHRKIDRFFGPVLVEGLFGFDERGLFDRRSRCFGGRRRFLGRDLRGIEARFSLLDAERRRLVLRRQPLRAGGAGDAHHQRRAHEHACEAITKRGHS
jgi:hypothetical protein